MGVLLMPSDAQALQSDVVALLPALRRFAARFVKSGPDIEDLANDTIVKVLSHIEDFKPGTSLKSWAFTIMRNTHFSQYNRAKRTKLFAGGDALFEVSVTGGQEIALYTEQVHEAIDRLPDDQRAALLAVVDGLSYGDASVLFGCEIGTIKSRVARARAALVVSLGEVTASQSCVVH